MRFLLDANMPHSAMRILMSAGHSANHVHDLGMGTATDHRRFRRIPMVNLREPAEPVIITPTNTQSRSATSRWPMLPQRSAL
jgi:predicted nuclease of predicted toxin-antitoxin system